jgi:phosphohistidine swiveling domain-containing protein
MILKGRVACKPISKIKGVVYNLNENNSIKFSKDFVLITEETSPKDMNYISKSKAILTEFGGLLSHAAIVSRELNIPCVVGIKGIIKIKTGTEVEIDLENGNILVKL